MSERDEDVQALRDLAARLVSEKVALQQQVEALRRDRATITVESLAAGVVRSVRTANSALAREAGAVFVVSDVQATITAGVSARHDRIEVVVPDPALRSAPASLSTVSMKVAHVPPPPGTPPARGLRDALEEAQAMFGRWQSGEGAAAAADATAIATRLLEMADPGTAPTLGHDLVALGDAGRRLAGALAAGRPPATWVTALAAASVALMEVATEAGATMTAEQRTQMTEAVATLNQVLAEVADRQPRGPST